MSDTAPLRVRAITPIHVADDELERRRIRYAALAPPGVHVHLDNLPDGSHVPLRLDDADAIAASDAQLTQEALRTDPDRFDAVLPDCVLDPGLDRLRESGFVLPVIGLSELTCGVAAAVGGVLGAVARNPAIAAELQRRLTGYGLADAFAGVHVLDLSFDDISDDAVWNAALDAARARFRSSGVTTIINGCSAVEVHTTGGVHVVDPTRTALQLLGSAHGCGLVPAPLRGGHG